jgi:hypothetical protein
MPCEVVPLRVDFSKMAAVAMETAPLFCFHGNCSKVCPTDSYFLAYLVPLDVDVVPIKFHQFLFGK